MPAKGTSLRTGERHVIFNPKFVRRILRNPKYKGKYTHADLKKIFDTANLHIKQSVFEDPSGFRLPNNLGVLVVNKYKPKADKVIINRSQSKLYKKDIPYLNLHSFGNMFNIKYCKVTNSNYRNLLKCFKFIPERSFNRELAKIIKTTGGEQYLEKNDQSFISKTRLTKLFRTAEITD